MAARESCMMRMRRALEEMVIGGVKTNIPLHQALLYEYGVIHVYHQVARGMAGEAGCRQQGLALRLSARVQRVDTTDF